MPTISMPGVVFAIIFGLILSASAVLARDIRDGADWQGASGADRQLSANHLAEELLPIDAIKRKAVIAEDIRKCLDRTFTTQTIAEFGLTREIRKVAIQPLAAMCLMLRR